MAAALTIRIDTSEVDAVFAALNLRSGPGLRAVELSLDKMAFGVQDDAARNQILRGEGAGARRVGDTPAHPSKLTSRTGTLRRSIRVNRTRALSRAIGSDVVYAGVHEFGIGRFPRRAYLAPALEHESPQFPGILSRDLQRLIDRA